MSEYFKRKLHKIFFDAYKTLKKNYKYFYFIVGKLVYIMEIYYGDLLVYNGNLKNETIFTQGYTVGKFVSS